MNTYDENDQSSIATFVKLNLPRHQLMALSTVDTKGEPWGVCVGLSYDAHINLIWKSSTLSEHSKNIAINSHVSICIFSQTENGDFGFYSKAIAHPVEDQKELVECLDIKYAQKGLPVPSINDFLNSQPRRIYKAIIQEAWVTDTRHLKTPVDLNVLRTEK